MELREYVSVVRRRWWIPALLVLVSLAAAMLYSTYYVKPVYEASTDLVVNKTVATGTGQQQIDQNSINTNLMLINTYKQIIKSPVVAKTVVEQNPQFGLTAGQLSSKIQINTMKDTQIITLVVQDSSYQRAAEIVTKVSDVFRDRVPTIMKLNNVSVLNQPDLSAPSGPINSNHIVLYVFSILVSLLIGIGIAFLLEYLDDKVRTEFDIEHELGLTLLAKIGKQPKNLKSSRAAPASQTAKDSVLRTAKEPR